MKSDDSSSASSSVLLYDVLGSATAGIISRIFTHPLDTVKARLQAPTGGGGSSKATTFRGPIDALLRTYRQEGVRALYGGFGAVIIGGTPGTVLYLTGYAFFRDSITMAVLNMRRHEEGDGRISTSVTSGKHTLSHSQEFAVHFMSGMLAETVSCIVYVPVDVVKERMQVQRKANNASTSLGYQYNGSWDALRQIARTEGMRGIYKGYGATLASFGPFSALYFMFYEQCKHQSRDYISRQRDQHVDTTMSNDMQKPVKDGDLPLVHLIACSAGAGALASWLTSPLDMAKLRLQVQRGQAAASANSSTAGKSITNPTTQYHGMIDCLRSIFAEGGVRGLFRGAGARVIHFAPATTITMTCYEKCRAFFAEICG